MLAYNCLSLCLHSRRIMGGGTNFAGHPSRSSLDLIISCGKYRVFSTIRELLLITTSPEIFSKINSSCNRLLKPLSKLSVKEFSAAGKESLEEKIITRKYSILIGIWYAYKKINPQYVALRKNSCGNEK